jgi:hypothetical protein
MEPTQITMDELAAIERSGQFECYEVVITKGGVVRYEYEPSATACQGKPHRAYCVSLASE